MKGDSSRFCLEHLDPSAGTETHGCPRSLSSVSAACESQAFRTNSSQLLDQGPVQEGAGRGSRARDGRELSLSKSLESHNEGLEVGIEQSEQLKSRTNNLNITCSPCFSFFKRVAKAGILLPQPVAS